MEAVVDLAGFDALLGVLGAEGYRVVGPVVRDGAIGLGELRSTDDLPRGWRDVQGPGTYRLERHGGEELFGWAVGPQSVKAELFPPRAVEWRAQRHDGSVTVEEVRDTAPPVAVVGARPCEVAAVRVLAGALDAGPAPDPRFHGRRAQAVVVAVECGRPSGTCFCASMGTGPDLPVDPGPDGAAPGADVVLTELLDEDGHRFLARAATRRGAALLEAVPHRRATASAHEARAAVLDRSESSMGRALDTDGLPGLLERNIEHPAWDDVAERCLSCGNCTLVCPTCFCSTVEDVSLLDGTVERHRSWASCFDLAHSYVHGGPVRASPASRYRQWCTHKLSTWWDQFGTSGCVGCGRCITWCPVGIDITEEAARIRSTDGARVRAGGGAAGA